MSERKQAIIAELESARRELVDLVQSLDAKALACPTCNEGWSAKDVLAHLAAGESGLRRRVDLVCNGESGAEPGFNLHENNKRQVELRRDRSLQDLLAEMAESGVGTRGYLEVLPEEALDRTGRLSSGAEVTVEGLLRKIANHERSHADEIRKAVAG